MPIRSAINNAFHVLLLLAMAICAGTLSYVVWEYNSTPYDLHSVRVENSVIEPGGTLHIVALRSHYRFCNSMSNRFILRKSTGAVVFRDLVPTISSRLGLDMEARIEFKTPADLDDDGYIYRVIVLSDCGLRVFSSGPREFEFNVKTPQPYDPVLPQQGPAGPAGPKGDKGEPGDAAPQQR